MCAFQHVIKPVSPHLTLIAAALWQDLAFGARDCEHGGSLMVDLRGVRMPHLQRMCLSGMLFVHERDDGMGFSSFTGLTTLDLSGSFFGPVGGVLLGWRLDVTCRKLWVQETLGEGT